MAPGDQDAMERLLFQAFGPKRKDLPSYQLRTGAPLNRLSWVARAPEGRVLGCLRFWQVTFNPLERPAVLLGPLAVDLALRGHGVARQLTRFGLNRATDLGFELCFVVGEPRLYRRFGFTNAAWSRISTDAPIPPRRLQVLELTKGILSQIDTPQTLRAYDKA